MLHMRRLQKHGRMDSKICVVILTPLLVVHRYGPFPRSAAGQRPSPQSGNLLFRVRGFLFRGIVTLKHNMNRLMPENFSKEVSSPFFMFSSVGYTRLRCSVDNAEYSQYSRKLVTELIKTS